MVARLSARARYLSREKPTITGNTSPSQCPGSMLEEEKENRANEWRWRPLQGAPRGHGAGVCGGAAWACRPFRPLVAQERLQVKNESVF